MDTNTREQLQAFAKQEGKRWKATLSSYWMRGEPVRGFPLLYGLRNHSDYGPAWLVRFKL